MKGRNKYMTKTINDPVKDLKKPNVPTPEEKLRLEIKKMEMKFKNELRTKQNDIDKWKQDSKANSCFKQAILTSVGSKENLEVIMEGLKLVAKNIKNKNWPLVHRIAGSSGNLSARGVCRVCDISLFGKNQTPMEHAMPCNVGDFRGPKHQCPFNKDRKEEINI